MGLVKAHLGGSRGRSCSDPWHLGLVRLTSVGAEGKSCPDPWGSSRLTSVGAGFKNAVKRWGVGVAFCWLEEILVLFSWLLKLKLLTAELQGEENGAGSDSTSAPIA